MKCPVTCDQLIGRRVLEFLGLLMIGDGVVTAVSPKRHVELWEDGPKTWRKMMQPFEEHPETTRWLGIAEAVVGVWLATSQRR